MIRSCTASLNANAPLWPGGVSMACQSPMRNRSGDSGTVCACTSAWPQAISNANVRVRRADAAAVRLLENGFPGRGYCALWKIVGWPAGEHDDLKHARLFGKKLPEPVHPHDVTLDELIVENDGCPQVLRERETVQR